VPSSRLQARVVSNFSTTIVEIRDFRRSKVEEAQAGQSRADFISKYGVALKEAGETLYWLRLLDASGELSNGSCDLLLKEADEIARVIAAIIVSTNKCARG
jgi:four helix bundle protein